MSNSLLSLLIAAGSGTWVFYKFQNHSGNNTKQSAIAASVVGVLIFIFLILILGTFIKNG